jgi:hypothetical protein
MPRIPCLAPILALALAFAAPSGAQTLLVQDDFSNPASGWQHQETASPEEGGFGTYAGGQYQMTPLQDGSYGLIPAPRQSAGGDVRMEADLFLYASVGNGGGGLYCRARGLKDFYLFLATGDGGLLIGKVRDGNPRVLARGSVRSVMAGSVDTRLVAECAGNRLRLSATEGSSLEAHDEEFSAGEAGLAVLGENAAGTSAVFDNYVLTDLGGGTPAATPERPGRPPAMASSGHLAAPAMPSGTATAHRVDDRAPPGAAARIRSLKAGQALIVVEHGDFLGTALIGRDERGMHLYDTTSEGGPAGMNLYINFSGDSFYSTIRNSTRHDSGIASWDVEVEADTGRGTCARMDLYPQQVGRLSVWDDSGRPVCIGQ